MSTGAVMLGAYALVAGSGIFLTQLVPVSPVYFLLGVSALLGVLVLGAPRFSRPVLPWLGLTALGLHLLYLTSVSEANGAFAYALNLVAVALGAFFFPRLDLRRLLTSRSVLVWTTIVLGTIETLVRWLLPFQEIPADRLRYMESSGSLFYKFKFNSLMYMDSNFVGMWLLVILLFQLRTAAVDDPPRLRRVESLWLAALLVLSICRAAILALAVYFTLRRAFRPGKRVNVLFVGLSVALVLGGVAVFFYEMATDDSFQSKFLILDLVMNGYLAAAHWDGLLLGMGLGTSADLLGGIAAHNFFAMQIIECGVVGLAITITVHTFYLRRCPFVARPLLFCFYFAGMSMAPMTAPYLYVALQLAFELGRRGALKAPVRSAPRRKPKPARRSAAAEPVALAR